MSNVSQCLYCGDKKLIKVTYRADNVGILKCSNCRVMMVDALNNFTESLYTVDYFQKKETDHNGYSDYLSSPVANVLGKYAFTRLFLNKPGNHLDLGCADGSLMEVFKEEGFNTTGLEISEEATLVARAKGLNVIVSNLKTFPSNIKKFDVITAFDLLEHVANPKEVLEGIYKNLHDNGFFVFSTLCVKKEDPTDFWFNNSLEHYVYYDDTSLNNILRDIFGEKNYTFFETEVNGISEFWGFGKKGKVVNEDEIISKIKKEDFYKNNGEASYLLSLFYNQLSKFLVSKNIIEFYENKWSPLDSFNAKFYNDYFQGKFENALKNVKQNKHLVPVNNTIFWQAFSDTQDRYFEINKKDITAQYDGELFKIRDQLFATKNELYVLKNSRVIGRIIRLREATGNNFPKLKKLPRLSLRKFKHSISPFLPEPLKKLLRKSRKNLSSIKNEAPRKYRQKITPYEVLENQKWDESKPLVSLVIPYYNRADTIDETLNSLSRQTFVNFETTIVDDGSQDEKSINKLKNLKNPSLHAKVIHQKNQGVAVARNSGIAQAKGKYIICLDSDDILEPTFIEKCTLILETQPDVSLVTTHRDDFGVLNETTINAEYDPLQLYNNNMVITAAEFRNNTFDKVPGGYKSNIGYEDWEFWLSLSERGFWGKLLPEPLFRYRTSMQSRYIEDKDVHWNNIKKIKQLHPNYKQTVKKLLAKNKHKKQIIDKNSALINMSARKNYVEVDNHKPSILVAISWMTFGGAETLIYNYCRELKNKFNISYVTGLSSENEWEYKFREITPNIYHLTNLFEDKELWLGFISNYIETRNIQILHIIHTSFVFDMLPEIKGRHPELRVVVTMFNDRAEHFSLSEKKQDHIDLYTSDNLSVIKHYEKLVPKEKIFEVIPNGIDCFTEFNPSLIDRDEERKTLVLGKTDIAIFFIGRLSEEKNPDVFLKVAESVLKKHKHKKIKFFIIGDGPMRQQIEKSIKEIGIKNITYLGYQSKVEKYLSAADIFVLPSSIEGFPLSILEAMSMNVATIASDVGAVSEVIDAHVDGFIVSPSSVEEITETIINLIKNPEILNKVKFRAREKVLKKYSNKSLGENYVRLYEEALR